MLIANTPARMIRASAPVRICDNGGWTDTWFAQHGKVFHIAVSPLIGVELRAFPRRGARPPITIQAKNFGDNYSIDQPHGSYGKHPVVEAAFDLLPVAEELEVEVVIDGGVPPGSSTGTSAAVAVAVLGALDCLTPGRLSSLELAAAAHRLETDLLHQQSGIQDQIAAAFGGINFIEMEAYPHSRVHHLDVSPATAAELESQLALIYVGEAHSSSVVHESVIRGLARDSHGHKVLERLRAAAEQARDAICSGDLAALGRSMIENTAAQQQLHAQLISDAHQCIIDVAKRHGALGWKVNGAGGRGGSVSVLAARGRLRRDAMLKEILQVSSNFREIPVRLNFTGFRVDEVDPNELQAENNE